MYFLIPFTFSSKSTYCQRVSRPYQAEKIQPGGGQVKRRRKKVCHCAFPRTNTRGEGVGVPGLDKQMTGNDRL